MTFNTIYIIACFFVVSGTQNDRDVKNIPSEKIKVSEIIEKITCLPVIEDTQTPDHKVWNDLLKKYVDSKGNVDYQNFKTDIKALDSYLEHLANNVPEDSSDKNKRLAYFINLYNAATVKLILDNYPVKSIKDLKNPWDKKWIKVADDNLSLGHIEHKILRKMNEPRIHFAINCASFSCPRLLNEAFLAPSLQSQLEQATKDFINDHTRNIITRDRIQLSNIFKWYRKDFTNETSLTEYIDTYTKVKVNTTAKVEFLKYNWNLNETR